MGSVAKEVSRAYDKIEGGVGDAWDKSGAGKVWDNGLKQGWWNMGAGTVVHHGVELAESVKDSLVPEMPDLSELKPETAAPGAGVQTSQQTMSGDSALNERRRLAARYLMSDTNRTGSALTRTASLKSTLG